MFTTEQKYKWLCQRLKITDINYWEKDALISLPKSIYFQFWNTDRAPTVDEAVISAMSYTCGERRD